VILAGFYWCVSGVEYGLWVRRGPGGGFMPLLAGIFTIVFAVWMMLAARNEKVSAELASWHALLPIAGLVGVLAGSYVVGLIPAIALFLVLWLKVVEHYPLKFSLVTGVSSAAVLYLVFGVWLQVPFPLGVLENIF